MEQLDNGYMIKGKHEFTAATTESVLILFEFAITDANTYYFLLKKMPLATDDK